LLERDANAAQLAGTYSALMQLPDYHPDRHRNHHQVFRKRDETQGHFAISADASALQFAFVNVHSLKNGYGSDASDEKRDRYRNPFLSSGDHQDAGERLSERIEIGVRHHALGE
jgi:hypothetical protein